MLPHSLPLSTLWTVVCSGMLVVVDCGHVAIIIFYTPFILISTHNPSYEQWLIGMGMGAGSSLLWRWWQTISTQPTLQARACSGGGQVLGCCLICLVSMCLALYLSCTHDPPYEQLLIGMGWVLCPSSWAVLLVLFQPGLASKLRLWLGLRRLWLSQHTGQAKAVNQGLAQAAAFVCKMFKFFPQVHWLYRKLIRTIDT